MLPHDFSDDLRGNAAMPVDRCRKFPILASQLKILLHCNYILN